MRVLQVFEVGGFIFDKESFIRYDPIEGTASVICVASSMSVLLSFIRYDPIEGTARLSQRSQLERCSYMFH